MSDTATATAPTPTPNQEAMKHTPVQKKNSMEGPGSDTQATTPPPPMRKLSRSQSITTSAIPSHFFLPPDMEDQWRKRRESLDNLNVDKVAPWMHLHDFSESEALARAGASATTESG